MKLPLYAHLLVRRADPYSSDVSAPVSHVYQCVRGPANGAQVEVRSEDPIVRVPATFLPGLIGIYRVGSGPEEEPVRQLRYDYAVEFTHDGHLIICNEVLAAEPAQKGVPRDEWLSQVHWVVRVGEHRCHAGPTQSNDFDRGSSFMARMVEAARQGGCLPTAARSA